MTNKMPRTAPQPIAPLFPRSKRWLLYCALSLFYAELGSAAALPSTNSPTFATADTQIDISIDDSSKRSINSTSLSGSSLLSNQDALKKLRNQGYNAHQTATLLLKKRALKPKRLLLALRQAGYTSTQSARAVEQHSQINSAVLTDLLFDQHYSASQSCRVLRHVYQVDAKQALVQLSISGYNNQDILQAIKNIYQLENDMLIVKLSEGYAYKIEPEDQLEPKIKLENKSKNKLKKKGTRTPLKAQSTQLMQSRQPPQPHKKLLPQSQQKQLQQNLQRAKKITSVLHQQGVKAELVAYLLQTRYNTDLALCAQMLRYVGYQDSKVFTALLNTYSPNSSALIAGFISAGYRADQVLPFLIKNFTLPNDRLRQQLQTMGYAPLVVRRAFHHIDYPLVANRALDPS